MSTLIRSNPHTHTQFCDGKSTAEEMVLSALDKGFHTLGFSSHSYYPPDISWCMAKESVPLYIAEVRRLQEKYASSLRIRLGLELDLYSLGHMDLAPYEYLIGSVHDYLSPVSGRLLSYDNKPAVNSIKGYLKNLQEVLNSCDRSYEVLEWKDNTLYILESLFLFYLRWGRGDKHAA